MTLRPYFGLLQKYGLLDFSKIAVERLLRQATGGAVSAFFFSRAMKNGNVYFGEHLGARQGVLRRHFFMYRLARNEIRRNNSHPFQVLEVGTYAGASAITWALAIKSQEDRIGQVLCVDPLKNYFSEEDIANSATPQVLRDMAQALDSGKISSLFEHNISAAGVTDIVHTCRAAFAEASLSMLRGSYDIVYIDANHRYSAVMTDLGCAAGLLRTGGILCGDDLEVQWQTLDQQYSSSRLSRDLIIDPKTQQFIHPGVSKAVWDYFSGPVSSWNGFWAMRKLSEESWEPVALDATFQYKALPPHLKWWQTKTRLRPVLRQHRAVPLSNEQAK